MFEPEAVFLEKVVFQGRVEMDEPAGDRAGRDAQANRRFARLGDIRISVGNAKPETKRNR